MNREKQTDFCEGIVDEAFGRGPWVFFGEIGDTRRGGGKKPRRRLSARKGRTIDKATPFLTQQSLIVTFFRFSKSISINKGETQMPQYVIAYLGGDQPSSPEEGKQHFSKYMDWLASLGDSAVSPANPLKNTSTVNSDGTVTAGGTTTMSGYTIIEADSMEAALSIAKACPFLDIGGSLEVSELVEMPSQKQP